MKECRHHLGWYVINKNLYECCICGKRVDKFTCDQIEAQKKVMQANCQHLNLKPVQGVKEVHYHCCDCGKLVE